MPDNSHKIDKKINDISLILRDLLKVIKVVSMYPEDNPLPQSLRRSFSEKLESIIEDYGEIKLRIKKDQILLADETVYQDRSKEENLSGIFFEAGITELTFRIGLQVEEIYKFLDVLKTYMNSSDKSLDLVALFWEAGISQVNLTSLEDVSLTGYDDKFDLNEFIAQGGAEDYSGNDFITHESSGEDYNAIFKDGREAITDDDRVIEQSHIDDSSDQTGGQREGVAYVPSGETVFYTPSSENYTSESVEISNDDEVSINAVEAAQAMGFDDLPVSDSNIRTPDTSLILNDEFKLSEEEEVEIRKIIEEDAKFDPYESTQDILKEMLLQETEMDAFYESVTICEKVASEFVSSGHLAEVSSLFQFMKKLDKRIRSDKPLWVERLKNAIVTAGSREKLGNLVTALNNNDQISSMELKKYLENFGWEALNGISEMQGQLIHSIHRDCLSTYLTEKGKDNINVIAKGMFDRQPEVVINTISILTQIGDDKAIKYLMRATDHKDDNIRLELVKSIKTCKNESCLEIIKKVISDNNSEIRKAAVDAMIERRGEKAFEFITDIINDDNFNNIENEDQLSLLKAFSILGGEHAVGFLAELILKYNFFRNSTLSFFRQAAFEALSYNKSEKCESTLVKLSNNCRPDIKAQAQNALNVRRDIIYGGQ